MKKIVYIVPILVVVGGVALYFRGAQNGGSLFDELPDGSKYDRAAFVTPSSFGDPKELDPNASPEVKAKARKEAKARLLERTFPEQIEDYVKSSGVEKEFELLDTMLNQQLEDLQADPSLTSEMKAMISDRMRDILDSQALMAKYKDALQNSMTEDELKELKDLYDNPLIKATQESTMGEDYATTEKKFVEYITELKDNPPSKERMELIKQMDNAMRASQSSIELTEMMMSGSDPEGVPEDQRKAFSEELTQNMTESTTNAFLYQTRSLSDDQIKELVELRQSAVSRKEVEVKQELSKFMAGDMRRLIKETTDEQNDKDSNPESGDDDVVAP